MGNIPTGASNKTREKTLALIDEYRSLGKSMGRKHDMQAQKSGSFQDSLEKLFDIAAKGTEKFIRVDRLRSPESKLEDINFLFIC